MDPEVIAALVVLLRAMVKRRGKIPPNSQYGRCCLVVSTINYERLATNKETQAALAQLRQEPSRE